MPLTFEGLEFGVFLITHWKILGLSLRFSHFTFRHCTEIKVISLTFWSIHVLVFPPITSEASCFASHCSDLPLLKPDFKILRISAGSLEDTGCEFTFTEQSFHLWSQRLKKKKVVLGFAISILAKKNQTQLHLSNFHSDQMLKMSMCQHPF